MKPERSPPATPGWSVYLLRCGDGSLYAGLARELERRVALHAAGKGARYTRSRLPVALAWSAGPLAPTAARKLEAALKRLTRREKLRLVEGDAALWQALLAKVPEAAGEVA